MTDHSKDSAPRTLDDLFDAGDTIMVTTSSPDGLSSRPVTVADVQETSIGFLVDRTADWSTPLETTPGTVNGAFADPKDNVFVSTTGTARITRERSEIERLWNPAASAFFDSADDPRIGVLRIEVSGGQWWDGPSSRVMQAVALVRTKVTGRHDDAGDMGSLAV